MRPQPSASRLSSDLPAPTADRATHLPDAMLGRTIRAARTEHEVHLCEQMKKQQQKRIESTVMCGWRFHLDLTSALPPNMLPKI